MYLISLSVLDDNRVLSLQQHSKLDVTVVTRHETSVTYVYMSYMYYMYHVDTVIMIGYIG